MFIGHNAIAFDARPAAPRTSLGVLTAAVMLPDLIWPIFLLFGIEHVRIDPQATRLSPLDFYDYPWTHSLLMTAAWAAAFALLYFAFTRYGRGAWLVGACVISHWVLDFLVHRPDLPLWPYGPRVGLGLWNHPGAAICLESAIFVAGVAVYLWRTRARDRIGTIAFWAFVIFLAAIYAMSANGAPPPSARAVAIVGLAGWLLPLWAAWFDRHREVV